MGFMCLAEMKNPNNEKFNYDEFASFMNCFYVYACKCNKYLFRLDNIVRHLTLIYDLKYHFPHSLIS